MDLDGGELAKACEMPDRTSGVARLPDSPHHLSERGPEWIDAFDDPRLWEELLQAHINGPSAYSHWGGH